MEGRMTMGSSMYLETVRVRQEVETVSLGMTLNNISPLTPPLRHKFRVRFEAKIMYGKNLVLTDTLCPYWCG